MAEFLDTITSDGRSESSMVDSIMMPILHSAINRAHDRVNSRDGDLQRLAEQSKFCDLAVMQLDACVSCLQSADDDREFHRQTTADLTEIRDRLLDRITETERAIADKDDELQRLRNSGRNPRSRKEEKKVLERNRKADLENIQDGDPVGSEINLIKETIDVTMVVMQNAISVSDARPCELQFCFEMENEIMATLFAGFARDFQSRSEQKSVTSSENWSSLGAFSGLMDDLSSLRCKLERFAGSMAEAKSTNPSIKIQGIGTKEEAIGGVNKVSMMIKAHETVIQKNSDNLDAIKESNRMKCQETDELLMCVQRLIQRLDSCADMNLNHEIGQSKCIMRSADTEDSNLLLAITEEIQTVVLRCMMKDFQQHMHLITNKSVEKANMRDRYSEELNCQAVVTGEIQNIVLRYVIKDFQQQMLDQVRVVIGQGVSMDLFRGAINDAEERNLQRVISGEVESILLKCAVKEFQHLMHDHELTNSIRQVVLMDFFRETIKNELNEKMADHWKHNEELRTVCNDLVASETRLHIESAVKEKVYTLALKDISNAWTIEKEKFNSVGQGVSMDLFRGAINDAEERNLQRVISGEVESILLRCVMKDFQHLMHDHELMNSVQQVVHMDFFRGTIKNELNEKMADHWKHNEELRTVCNGLIASETLLHIESAVKEKVYTLTLKDISNAYTIEKEKSTSVDQGLSMDFFHGAINDSEERNLQRMISGEVQTTLLRSAMKDFQHLMHDRELTNSIQQVVFMDFFRGTIKNELNGKMVDHWKHTEELRTLFTGLIASETRFHIESAVKEKVYTLALKDIANAWTIEKEKFNSVGQGVSMDLFHGAINDAEELNLQRVISGEVQTTLLRCVMKDFQHLIHDHELTYLIRQVVLMDFFRETIKKMADHWKQNEELRTVCNNLIASEMRLHIESAVREKVYTLALKDIADACTIEKEKSTSVGNKSSSFIQELDSLLCCSEEENALLGPGSDSEKEHKAEYITQDSEHETLMIEENGMEMNFNSACDKFKKTLMQLGTSKMIIKDLGSDQAADLNDGDNEGSDHNVHLEVTNGPTTNRITGFGFSLGEFFQVITDLEKVLHQKLDINFVRLAMVKNQLMQFVGSASSLRRKESLYKQAFIRRCESLQKAENEVDILGDQVDTLLCLLQRIYKTLQYHAPALQQCSGVLNILTLIKKELNRMMA